MRTLRLLRRTLLTIALAAAVAGCAMPQENRPADLDRDRDNNGIPDDEERNLTNASEEPALPGADIPGAPDPAPAPAPGPAPEPAAPAPEPAPAPAPGY